jgi:hypothetical protein
MFAFVILICFMVFLIGVSVGVPLGVKKGWQQADSVYKPDLRASELLIVELREDLEFERRINGGGI